MAAPPGASTGRAVDAVALLEEMLRIPSVTGREEPFARWFEQRLAALGFAASRDAAGNVIGTWGGGSREVALVGHIDTVPGEIPVVRDGDLLRGRGAVDAKGPLAAAVAAVAALPRDGVTRYTVVGAVDEEGDSRGALHLASRPAPAALIVLEPSGWESVTVGYRGSLRCTLEVRQAVAHGAGPEPGAADRAISVLRSIQDRAAPTAHLRPFERLDVRVLRMHNSGDGLAETATLTIGMRLPVGIDVSDLSETVRALAAPHMIEISHAVPAFRGDKGSPPVRALIGAIRAAGGSPTYKVKTGTADVNVLAPAWDCASAVYGPGDARLDHTPDEAIDVGELRRATEVLAAALRSL